MKLELHNIGYILSVATSSLHSKLDIKGAYFVGCSWSAKQVATTSADNISTPYTKTSTANTDTATPCSLVCS